MLATREIRAETGGTPPTKRPRVTAPAKPRNTAYIDLENRGEEDGDSLETLISSLKRKRKIVVIAGAGISVSAGSMLFFSLSAVDLVPFRFSKRGLLML